MRRLKPGEHESGVDRVAHVTLGKEIKYAEENSMKEHPFKLIPHLVKLWVSWGPLQKIPDILEYYIRAPNGTAAATVADKLFHNWEKLGAGFNAYDAYPDTEGADGHKISDAEFLSAWKHAQQSKGLKWEYKHWGPRVNPSFFAYRPGGRRRPTDLLI